MITFDFTTLITDRSAGDTEVLAAALAAVNAGTATAEQAALAADPTAKGGYNYTDLNRVTACMEHLAETLRGYGYDVPYERIVVPHEWDNTSRLPDGYTELTYIESTGTQYVDTGFKPNQDTRIKISTVFHPPNDAKWLFGARNGIYEGTFNFLIIQNNYRSDYFNSANETINETYSDRFLLDKDKNVTKINDAIKKTAVKGAFQCRYSLYLFANNNSGAAAGHCASKVYACQVYDNGTLVRDFMPCINPSGAVGLYDLVGRQFYGNSGTGTLAAGPAVEVPPPVEEYDDYTWYAKDHMPPALAAAYLGNVAAIRAALPLADGTAEPPGDMEGLTAREANDIESILLAVEDAIGRMERVINLGWAMGLADIGLYGGLA